jgi:predicted nucleic acid-binding protein
MPKRIPVELYCKQSRKLLFDANVIISIIWPVPQSRLAQAAKYSRLFSSAIKFEQEICVDSIILSEVVNRIARLEYDRHLHRVGLVREDLDFKAFRGITEGIETFKQIHSTFSRTIFPKFDVVGKSFCKEEISSIDFRGHDFNDLLIESVCKENDCILVTHDGDFGDSDVDIISGNTKLLSEPSACPS